MESSPEGRSPSPIACENRDTTKHTTSQLSRVFNKSRLKVGALAVVAAFAFLLIARPTGSQLLQFFGFDKQIEQNADRMMAEGRQTFRHDTFGDESFWGGQLMLHQAIAGAANGGTGPGLSPIDALALGL